MTKLEKVIKGLECCTKVIVTYEARCTDCPYYDGNSKHCIEQTQRDALELLKDAETQLQYRDEVIYEEERETERLRKLVKEQEPRALTLEELDIIYNTEKTHVWPFNRPPYLWMTINPDVRLTAGYWICWRDVMFSLENSNPFYVRENYGKAWTIWTKEPTDEQRKAVKWND